VDIVERFSEIKEDCCHKPGLSQLFAGVWRIVCKKNVPSKKCLLVLLCFLYCCLNATHYNSRFNCARSWQKGYFEQLVRSPFWVVRSVCCVCTVPPNW